MSNQKDYRRLLASMPSGGYNPKEDATKIICALLIEGANFRRVLKMAKLPSNKDTRKIWSNLLNAQFIKHGQKEIYMDDDFTDAVHADTVSSKSMETVGVGFALLYACATGILKRKAA